MPDKILLCFATEKGLAVLRHLVAAFPRQPFAVCTLQEKNVLHSYDADIRELAADNDLPVYSWKTVRGGGADFIRDKEISSIICIGWSYLISDDIVAAVDRRVVVAHDSLLPRYRGFAPLPTALLNDEPEVGVSVLFAVDEVDAGDIIYQDSVPVGKSDTIADLIHKVIPVYVAGVESAVSQLIAGGLQGSPQDHSRATFSIWREPDDMYIDWNQSAEYIERFIRALGSPYTGAKARLGEQEVVVHTAVVERDLTFERRDAGKVWTLTSAGEPVVVCGTGMLRITGAEIDGQSLIPMKRLRVRFR